MLARILGGNFIPITGVATAESPSRDSRKTAACTGCGARLRH
jgi:hypothetical protein